MIIDNTLHELRLNSKNETSIFQPPITSPTHNEAQHSVQLRDQGGFQPIGLVFVVAKAARFVGKHELMSRNTISKLDQKFEKKRGLRLTVLPQSQVFFSCLCAVLAEKHLKALLVADYHHCFKSHILNYLHWHFVFSDAVS